MKKNIAELKKKIVDPNDLFKKASVYYKKKTGINKIFFLTPDKGTGIFITQYPIKDCRKHRAGFALMPVYINGEIACFIIIKGKINNHWLKTNAKWLEEMKKTIEYCLGAVMSYNQALERIIFSQT